MALFIMNRLESFKNKLARSVILVQLEQTRWCERFRATMREVPAALTAPVSINPAELSCI